MPGLFHVSRLNRRKPQYRADWNKTVKEDRKFLGIKCEKCGSTDRVQRHHILEKSKHRGPDCLMNLMLLCFSCHLRQHRKLKRK